MCTALPLTTLTFVAQRVGQFKQEVTIQSSVSGSYIFSEGAMNLTPGRFNAYPAATTAVVAADTPRKVRLLISKRPDFPSLNFLIRLLFFDPLVDDSLLCSVSGSCFMKSFYSLRFDKTASHQRNRLRLV
jgi:hypothetical protein